MTGAQGFATDEARFTPITVAGIAAIIALSGVLIGSVVQSGGGGQRLAPRIASGNTASQGQAVPAVSPAAATLSPVVPETSGPAALSTTGVSPAATSTAAIAGQGVVSAGTLAPAHVSGSSQPPASIAATSVPATRPVQGLRSADPQSAPAPARLTGPQFTTNVAKAAAASVAPTSGSGAAILQATEAQVLGAGATTGASLGITPATSVPASTASGSSSVAGAGDSVVSGVPFPNVQPYTGPISAQSEAYMALGLPADFQFGGEPDPYVAGSYESFVADAAAGDKAAQAGLDLAMSQGANFSAFH